MDNYVIMFVIMTVSTAPKIAKELQHLKRVPIAALEPLQGNLKDLSKREYGKLKRSLTEHGIIVPFFVWLEAGKLLDGHQRRRVFIGEGWTLDVPIIEISAADEQEAKRKLLVIASQYGKVTQEGWDEFTFDIDDAAEIAHFDGLPFVFGELPQEEPEAGDAEPQVDKAEELREAWGVKLGQMWRLPSRVDGKEHRLICGDCTDGTVVDRVMGGERAALCHADPPYGMGKEKDGIANDNLYREKLDVFQMAWWNAQRTYMADNGSAYIWGNAEDLWRLWYVGGLRDSERLTFRNHIVWDKGGGGMTVGTAIGRMYTPSENCLFFMLGEQGFNNNADNYWEGWEPIRGWLDGQRKASGLTTSQCNEICGKQNMTQSAFTKGGFRLIRREDYIALREATGGKFFKREYDDLKREYDDLKREYDDLKREFYSTRAYFDNTHDNMTDVWQFQRVQGEDRHGHATPKPVAMVERAIKSSSPDGAIVYAPFAGTLPEVIAAENLARQCRAVEISPAYVAVALQRYQDAFGITPELIQ